MAIRTITVTPPAAGTDWTYTVPGQWWPRLIGVIATLTTATTVTSVVDESGNGRTATTLPVTSYVLGNVGPFSGGADNWSIFNPGPNTPGASNAFAASASALALNTATFSADTWLKIPTATNGISGIFGMFFNAGSGQKYGLNAADGSANPDPATVDFSNSFRAFFATGPGRNAWHHVGLTYDGATWTLYIDGASAATHAGDPPPGTGTACSASAAGNRSAGSITGNQAAVAYYGTALSGAQMAAHAAVSSSWGAYKTAVLADSPLAFYKVGAPPVGASRISTLRVTDGTNAIIQVPANFSAATTQAFIWSWQVLGTGVQSSTDGTINSVAIPELNVAPGYTIGTRTLDLAGTDQWSSITLWFDDGTNGGTPGQWQPPPYLDALLVPQWWPNRPQ